MLVLLALVSLIVPGLLIGRALRIPFAWSAAFPLSALLLAETVIVYSIVGIPIRLTNVLSLAGAVTVIASALLAFHRRADRNVGPAPEPAQAAPRWLVVGSVALAVAIGLGIFLRNTKYPLSGFDTLFRWEGLARLMLEHESIDYYPPRTPEDFEKYVYPDGLPPLTASVYWCFYAGMGEPFPPLTAIVVVLQFTSILALTFFAANELMGKTGAYAALAALAASSLFITGVAIGQETGYTALSVAGQFCFGLAATRQPRAAPVIVAACFAAMGALAREYGPVLAVAGLMVLASQPQTRRWLPLFCLIVLVLSAPWYVRNWYLTGNPVYSNSVAGLFPVNPAHAGLLEAYRGYFGLQNLTAEDWFAVLKRLVGRSPLPMLIGIPAMLIGWRRFWPLIAVTAAAVLLWLWSVPYTGGGLAYSMRVLTPAWVALSISAGAAGVAWLEKCKGRGACAIDHAAGVVAVWSVCHPSCLFASLRGLGTPVCFHHAASRSLERLADAVASRRDASAC